MKNKKLLLSVTALTLAVAGAVWYGGSKVMAANSTGHDAMVSTLSAKLGVSEDKVTAAFDSVEADQQAARAAEQKTQLDKAVTDKVITQDQEDKLIAKQAEVKAAQDKIQSDLKQWYTDNGIDQTKIAPYTGRGEMGGGKGMGGRGHMGNE
ncbi:MAG: hypothetical protein WCI57_05475 [Candidatus Berkelbacteria bacterium]